MRKELKNMKTTITKNGVTKTFALEQAYIINE
jgi:hypothetical protein